MSKKYLKEDHHDTPNLIDFLKRFREVVLWDSEEDHQLGMLRFQNETPSHDTAFVFKFEDDQLLHMHTVGMKFCIDIYYFDKRGNFINKWMNVPPGHPGNTLEYGTDQDELHSKSMARYAVEVVNPDCRPCEMMREDSADAAYSRAQSIQADANARGMRNLKLSLGGMAAAYLVPIAIKYGEKFLTQAGKACKDYEGPRFNVCKTSFNLKALRAQINKLKELKSQCKDDKCKTQIDMRITKLRYKIKDVGNQLAYEKKALSRSGG